MITFQDFLIWSVPRINKKIDGELEIWKKDVLRRFPKLEKEINEFITTCKGGKRLRGIFILLGFSLFKEKIPPDLYTIAASYEISQTAILIHDDVIDKSGLRRNIPTLQKRLGNDHYATSQTICLGDLGFSISALMLSRLIDSTKSQKSVLTLFFQTIHETMLGQILDVYAGTHKKNIFEKDIRQIMHTKTAIYSVIRPLQIGALTAGANEREIIALEKIGEVLGSLFQMQDDILGVFSIEETTGKSIFSDCREGKMTLLYLKAYKNANTKMKSYLDDWYGNENVGPRELEEIKKIFVETGSLLYARSCIDQYVSEFNKIVSDEKFLQKDGILLRECLNMLLEREK